MADCLLWAAGMGERAAPEREPPVTEEESTGGEEGD